MRGAKGNVVGDKGVFFRQSLQHGAPLETSRPLVLKAAWMVDNGERKNLAA